MYILIREKRGRTIEERSCDIFDDEVVICTDKKFFRDNAPNQRT